MHYDVIVEPPQQQNRGSTDIAQASHNITFACADGVTAAMAIHRSFFLALAASRAQRSQAQV